MMPSRADNIRRLDPVAKAIKEIGLEATEQMVHNLSGVDVTWSGGEFRVNVRTGNLRRHTRMEYPLVDEFSVLVFNDAEYAGTIERGMSGEDRKTALLQNAKVSKAGRKYKIIPTQPGSLIPFWTVTEDSRLKDQSARPFTQATAEQIRSRISDLIQGAIVEMFRGDTP